MAPGGGGLGPGGLWEDGASNPNPSPAPSPRALPTPTAPSRQTPDARPSVPLAPPKKTLPRPATSRRRPTRASASTSSCLWWASPAPASRSSSTRCWSARRRARARSASRRAGWVGRAAAGARHMGGAVLRAQRALLHAARELAPWLAPPGPAASAPHPAPRGAAARRALTPTLYSLPPKTPPSLPPPPPPPRQVRVLRGEVRGIALTCIDTPGLHASSDAALANRAALRAAARAYKKHKPDFVLYVDRWGGGGDWGGHLRHGCFLMLHPGGGGCW
jgi:hypothetical protein